MPNEGIPRRSPADAGQEQSASLDELTPGCEIVEGSGVGSHFERTLTHTIHQWEPGTGGVTFAPGLYLREPRGWYVAELQREPGGEVTNLHLISGPWANSLYARLQQLAAYPLSVRPGPCDPDSLPPHTDSHGAPAAAGDWAERWARQAFHGAEYREAVAGYLAAVWGRPGVAGERRHTQAWIDGWVAGCTARMLGYKALHLAVQQHSSPPYPGVPPYWLVVNLFSGLAIPYLIDIPTRTDAERWARRTGLLHV